MKTWQVRVGLAAAAVFILGVVTVYLARPVAQVVLVKRGKAVNSKPGSVTVLAAFEMDLRSELGGRLSRSDLEPGNAVRQGDFLAQIDPGDLKLEIERLEQDYEATKQRIAVGSQIALELASAEETLANFERQTKAGAYPEAELIKQRRSVEQIRLRYEQEKIANRQAVEADENQLKVKRRQLEKMTITAPFDGVVSEVLARPGDIIGGNTIIAHLISVSRTVEARISEDVFADVAVGQSASVRFLTYGEETYRAKVAKILPTADPATQRYVVYLDVDIPKDKLVPGITGEVVIDVGEHENTLILPRRAVFGTNLYAVTGGRVELRKVKLGYVSLNEVEILSGAKEGEAVVVEQIDRYQPGDHVRTEVQKF